MDGSDTELCPITEEPSQTSPATTNVVSIDVQDSPKRHSLSPGSGNDGHSSSAPFLLDRINCSTLKPKCEEMVDFSTPRASDFVEAMKSKPIESSEHEVFKQHGKIRHMDSAGEFVETTSL